MLFGDLVGFTSLSDDRDPEDVRELLTRYFDLAQRIVARYGGTIEKFIGDAVMAVWGTPTAREDDAERSVRAALEFVDAISGLAADSGIPELRMRAAVVSGETAVTLAAEGQGMVAGDVVNTASRLQAAASAGTVLVNDATRHASVAAIDYEDAGEQALRGRARPLRAWRALRVVAGIGGSLRPAALEPPFVGRDRELRLIRELFEATKEEGTARAVSIIGQAGIGKSRLTWEFEKYIDGLVDEVRWHRGRCPAYGDGVAFWALGEMVRMRASIAEEDPPAPASAKLRRTVEAHVADPQERRFIEPRLAQLLGLEDRAAGEQAELFSAWRLFFERLSEEAPVVLVFEDLHWADAGVFDFIEHLLDVARDRALFVLAEGRPELLERRPGWGAGTRSLMSMTLDTLRPAAMEELLRGLVPGLPDELLHRIQDRAGGVPLYAVETVRMLLDRGALRRRDNQYVVAGEIGALDVPETLHALIAARLDSLGDAERRLLQDAAVLGQTFTRAGLAAVAGLDEPELEPLLRSLVRKELLALQLDPMSPERGQYGFLQALVRKVAHDTLSRRDRKARHLRAAAYVKEAWGEDADEIAEVLASHYVGALEAEPEASDAPQVRAAACAALVAAAQRSAALAASLEAQRYYDRAAELADNTETRADLIARAGEAALRDGREEDAAVRFITAIELLEAHGAERSAARVSARLAEVLWIKGDLDDARLRMQQALEVLRNGAADEDLAAVAAQLAKMEIFSGRIDAALEHIDIALEAAERLRQIDVLSDALNTKHLGLSSRGRHQEAEALLRHALRLAIEADAVPAAVRAYGNLGHRLHLEDRYEEALAEYERAIALTRQRGDYSLRFWMGGAGVALWMLGRWDEALQSFDEIPDRFGGILPMAWGMPTAAILAARGELANAETLIRRLPGFLVQSPDPQLRAFANAVRAVVLAARGDHAACLRHAEAAAAARETEGIMEFVKEGLRLAGEAALELGDFDKAAEVIATIDAPDVALQSPYMAATGARLGARLAARQGDAAAADTGFAAATTRLRERGLPFPLAVTLLEHAEWLRASDRGAASEPLLAEAEAIFERLRAQPWVTRARPGAESIAHRAAQLGRHHVD